MKAWSGLAAVALALSPAGCARNEPPRAAAMAESREVGMGGMEDTIGRVVRTEQEWRAALTPEQYRVLRQKGTERAFTGAYWNHHAAGIYRCAGCGLELFDAAQKFDSGTGWPSYWAPVAKGHVREHADASLGMMRVEVVCARCGGHLGHLFDDGPEPTGLRYCINSAALEFDTRK